MIELKDTKTLKKNYEFSKVLKNGKYYGGTIIECFIQKNNLNNNFIGIAISKKAGKSFYRNKIKRYIRENYSFFENKLKKGYNIVFLLRKNLKEIPDYYNIKQDLEKIFKKAEIIENDDK